MKVSTILVALAALASRGSALPQRGSNANRGGSRAQQQADRQALGDLNGTEVDPNLPNGTILLDNGQGRCVAVSGNAVCNGVSG